MAALAIKELALSIEWGTTRQKDEQHDYNL